MGVPKPSASRYYRPELDVVRFLAFLLVFLHHTLPQGDDPRIVHSIGRLAPFLGAFHTACGFGLSLFFTLSAFLICELLLRERDATGTVAVKQFYIRRILRIWPLYYLALAIAAVIAFFSSDSSTVLPQMGWFAVFLGAWFSALHGWILNPVSPLWSISVEEQFYLFAPWIVKYFNRKSLYRFCALLIVVANAWLYYFGYASVNGHRTANDTRIWADTFVQFEGFAAGILLCLILHGRLPKFALWQRLMFIAGCGISWMVACYGLHSRFIDASENPGSWPLIGGYALGALGSVLMLLAFLGANPKFLPGWAVYFGRISFGLYVYHQFALDTAYHLLGHGAQVSIRVRILRVGLSFGLTILMAAVSYRYFETPFLKMKKRHSVIESQPIAVAPNV
jgi:peptidoglycan/LPS O-acetylase OafA/YrhL